MPPGPPQVISPSVGRILAGPSAAPADRKLATRFQRQSAWPYTHSFPPPQSVRVHPEGIIPAPAGSTQTVVLSYQVPDGFQFAFVALMNIFSGSGFALGSTDITWVLDVNTPIPAPAGGSAQGYPIQGMSPSNLPKGAFASGLFAPWRLPKPEILNPLDTLRSKVTTNGAVIIPGAPNFFIAVFLGWMWQATK